MIIGVGMDMVEVERMRRLLRQKGERALQRLFTTAEREYAHSHPEPERQLAARVAAKEAAYKALAGSDLARAIGWRELEVLSTKGHAPTLSLHGRAIVRANELGVDRIHLTITHTELMAAATVIAESTRA